MRRRQVRRGTRGKGIHVSVEDKLPRAAVESASGIPAAHTKASLGFIEGIQHLPEIGLRFPHELSVRVRSMRAYHATRSEQNEIDLSPTIVLSTSGICQEAHRGTDAAHGS